MTTQKSLWVLTGLMQELRRIDPEFPIQYALCLCEIARHQGLSLTELAQDTGIPLSTVSRIVGTLSGTRGRCAGLVKVRFSSTEARRKELSLTARGANLVSHLTGSLENAASHKKIA